MRAAHLRETEVAGIAGGALLVAATAPFVLAATLVIVGAAAEARLGIRTPPHAARNDPGAAP